MRSTAGAAKARSMAWLLAGGAVISLAGCGFHLRGAVELPPQMARTYIQGDPYGALERGLRAQLQAAGARVVDEAAGATATLRVAAKHWQRRVLSVGADAKVSEYELSYRVTFSVQGREGDILIPPEEVSVVRDFRFDPNDVLGKTGEQGLLREEMERDMVQAIMRRIGHART